MIKIIITSLFLGIGLAMDACAVSMANGMNHPKEKYKKILLMTLMFGIFQGFMPFIGYLVGSAILSDIEWLIPYVALGLLGFLGIDMIVNSIKGGDEHEKVESLTLKVLFIQAIATSIDALSVGFTISNYNLIEAIVCVSIVAISTFIICIFGVKIGKKFGTKLGNKAELIGGIILVLIGIEIFISGLIGK